MKKISILFLLIISICLCLTGCSKKNHYEVSEYMLEMAYKDDFRILQLTDIHLANKDDRERQYKFLKGTIDQANADLILIDGDLFTFADKKTAKELFSFLDEFNIPWTVTFGNHDEQCYFSIDWLTGYLNKLNDSNSSNCLFKDIQDDDIYGSSNFVINLKDGNNIVEQIIIMDSNRYNYGEYAGYDYIKEEQIEWYSEVIDYTTQINGSLVKSLLFFHIPLPEFNTAWNEHNEGNTSVEFIFGEKGENVSCPKYNSGLFSKILEKGSTDGIFVGHDHLSSFILKYKGIYLGYGVNSTDRIYFDESLLGGQVIVVHNDNTLSFEQIIRSLDEYE